MNNSKLTNGLLIALIALTFINFIGWAVKSGHHHKGHHHHHHFMCRSSFNRGGWRSFGHHHGFRVHDENFGGFHERGFSGHSMHHHFNRSW